MDDEKTRLANLLRAERSTKRQRLLARLNAEPNADRHALRLERCGQPIGLTCTNCGAATTAYSRCDQKWCPSCAPRLAHRSVNRYSPVCMTFQRPLFVTFTVKNYRTRKTTGLRETRQAFTRLRRLRWWTRAVKGGVAQLEMTRRGKGWHPHIHALIDCAWLAVSVPRPGPGLTRDQYQARARAACTEVAQQWSLAAGRPGSIKVRNIHVRDGGNPTQALREVLKYSVTAETLDKITGNLSPLLDELSLTRNLVSFGSAYNHPSLKKPREILPCQCGAFGCLVPDHIIDRWKAPL